MTENHLCRLSDATGVCPRCNSHGMQWVCVCVQYSNVCVNAQVAFSASKRPGGAQLKDAHKDAEEGGVFAWNVTSEGLAHAMNLSSAPLPATESEFELAGLAHSPGARARIAAAYSYAGVCACRPSLSLSLSLSVWAASSVCVCMRCCWPSSLFLLSRLLPCARWN